jgi:ribosomal protein S18 acetylase RimI-like enzyme
MPSNLSVKVMSRADLDLAVEWAAAEGWNPGRRDAAAFHVADPAGFLMGFVDGQPAACISVVRYGADYGFLGFYIAAPEWRGRGHGMALWRAGMQHLGRRVIGLDGVVAQQDNYRKSGFVLAHRNIRFGGRPQTGPFSGQAELVDPARIGFDRLAAFDRRFFPAARDAFLTRWLATPGHHALAAMVNGEIAALGVIRPCRRGRKIGPLYAETPALAADLLAALCGDGAGDEPVFLDVPETNPAAIRLAEAAGLTPEFETARMYRGAVPQVEIDGLYGITSFELG